MQKTGNYFPVFCPSHLKVVFGLDVHEQLSGHTKSRLKEQGCVGGKRAVGIEQFVEHGIRHTHILGKLTLRNATVFQFVFDNLPWVRKY